MSATARACLIARGPLSQRRTHQAHGEAAILATETKRQFAVITEASSGIGFESARERLDNGLDLRICAQDSGIQPAATQLPAAAKQVIPSQPDLVTYEGSSSAPGPGSSSAPGCWTPRSTRRRRDEGWQGPVRGGSLKRTVEAS
jgi:hypothetical protein